MKSLNCCANTGRKSDDRGRMTEGGGQTRMSRGLCGIYGIVRRSPGQSYIRSVRQRSLIVGLAARVHREQEASRLWE